MKGWFNMEEFKNGVITEEALSEIAGGLSVSFDDLKTLFVGAGVGIVGLGAVVGAALAGEKLHPFEKAEKFVKEKIKK